MCLCIFVSQKATAAEIWLPLPWFFFFWKWWKIIKHSSFLSFPPPNRELFSRFQYKSYEISFHSFTKTRKGTSSDVLVSFPARLVFHERHFSGSSLRMISYIVLNCNLHHYFTPCLVPDYIIIDILLPTLYIKADRWLCLFMSFDVNILTYLSRIIETI